MALQAIDSFIAKQAQILKGIPTVFRDDVPKELQDDLLFLRNFDAKIITLQAGQKSLKSHPPALLNHELEFLGEMGKNRAVVPCGRTWTRGYVVGYLVHVIQRIFCFTPAALKEMLLPGLITIITPIIIGLVFGAEPLGGYMAGVCVSGVMWAIFQNNAGGAWDNAKKSFEAGVEINGEMTYKGSDAHKAAVTGDTVGDPFKDTSGPSMNILIKLTCLVGLVMAPLLGGHGSETALAEGEQMIFISEDGTKTVLADKQAVKDISKEVQVEMSVEDDGTHTAVVTVTTTENGEESTETRTFTGATAEEVKAQVEAFRGADVRVKGDVIEVIEEIEEDIDEDQQ